MFRSFQDTAIRLKGQRFEVGRGRLIRHRRGAVLQFARVRPGVPGQTNGSFPKDFES